MAYLDEYWLSKVKQMLLGLNLEQREFVAMTAIAISYWTQYKKGKDVVTKIENI